MDLGSGMTQPRTRQVKYGDVSHSAIALVPLLEWILPWRTGAHGSVRSGRARRSVRLGGG